MEGLGNRTVGDSVWQWWEAEMARMGSLVDSEHSGNLAQ